MGEGGGRIGGGRRRGKGAAEARIHGAGRLGLRPLKQLRPVPVRRLALRADAGLFVRVPRQPFVTATTPTPEQLHHADLLLVARRLGHRATFRYLPAIYTKSPCRQATLGIYSR